MNRNRKIRRDVSDKGDYEKEHTFTSLVSKHAGRWPYVAACLGGLIVGALAWSALHRVLLTAPDSKQLTMANSLLVAQQLDEVFQKLEERVGNDPNELSSFRELIEVFYLYDKRFIEQNQGSELAAVESAYAARRLGLCALLTRDLPLSKIHYREAQRHFEQMVDEDPSSLLSLNELIDTHTTLAMLEQGTGDLEHSKREFYTAVKLTSRMSSTGTAEADGMLAPMFQTLANLGVTLKLYDDALYLAYQFEQSAKSALQSSPTDPVRIEKVSDAVRFHKYLNEYCRRIRRQT